MLQITRHLRIAGHLSSEHSMRLFKKRALRAWRQYVVFSKTKASKSFKALSFWMGRNLLVRLGVVLGGLGTNLQATDGGWGCMQCKAELRLLRICPFSRRGTGLPAKLYPMHTSKT